MIPGSAQEIHHKVSVQRDRDVLVRVDLSVKGQMQALTY